MCVEEVHNEATVLLCEDDADDVLLTQIAFEKARLANPLQIVRDGEEAITYLKGEGRFADRTRFPLPKRAPQLRHTDHLSRVVTFAHDVTAVEVAVEVRASETAARPGRRGDLEWCEVALNFYVRWFSGLSRASSHLRCPAR